MYPVTSPSNSDDVYCKVNTIKRVSKKNPGSLAPEGPWVPWAPRSRSRRFFSSIRVAFFPSECPSSKRITTFPQNVHFLKRILINTLGPWPPRVPGPPGRPGHFSRLISLRRVIFFPSGRPFSRRVAFSLRVFFC